MLVLLTVGSSDSPTGQQQQREQTHEQLLDVASTLLDSIKGSDAHHQVAVCPHHFGFLVLRVNLCSSEDRHTALSITQQLLRRWVNYHG